MTRRAGAWLREEELAKPDARTTARERVVEAVRTAEAAEAHRIALALRRRKAVEAGAFLARG